MTFEVGAPVELKPPGRYMGQRGVIRRIGRDADGELYIVRFRNPVEVCGIKFMQLAFRGQCLKAWRPTRKSDVPALEGRRA